MYFFREMGGLGGQLFEEIGSTSKIEFFTENSFNDMSPKTGFFERERCPFWKGEKIILNHTLYHCVRKNKTSPCKCQLVCEFSLISSNSTSLILNVPHKVPSVLRTLICSPLTPFVGEKWRHMIGWLVFYRYPLGSRLFALAGCLTQRRSIRVQKMRSCGQK